MRLIIRGKHDDAIRAACKAALNEHYRIFGDYGIIERVTTYTVKLKDSKIAVEIVNRNKSYVATPMIKPRKLKAVHDETGLCFV